MGKLPDAGYLRQFFGVQDNPNVRTTHILLVDLLTSVGFSNYPGEWWHYSCGESAWALRVEAPHAVYGAAPDPVNAGF